MPNSDLPDPVTLPQPRRMPRAAVALLTVGGLLGLLILARLAWALTEPVPIVAAPLPQTSAVASSAFQKPESTWPPQLVMMAEAVSTALAPTVEPVTPEPYVMSTVPPPVICGSWTEINAVCTQPVATKPPPTPYPDCPVAPSQKCTNRGYWQAQRAKAFEGVR